MRQFIFDLFTMVVVAIGITSLTVFILACLTIVANADTRTIKTVITETAVEYGIDPNLALAVAKIESDYNPYAIGSQKEVGLFQLHPRYFKNAPYEVKANVKLGIKHLLYWKKRCPHQQAKQFVICYNRGTKPIRYPERVPYYKKVKAVYDKLNRTHPSVASIR